MTLLPCFGIVWRVPAAVQVRRRQGARARSAGRGPPFSDRGTWPVPRRPVPELSMPAGGMLLISPIRSWPARVRGGRWPNTASHGTRLTRIRTDDHPLWPALVPAAIECPPDMDGQVFVGRSSATALRWNRSGRAHAWSASCCWRAGGWWCAGRPSGQAVLAAPFAGASGLALCCLVPVGVCGDGVRDGGPGGECLGESGDLEDAQDARGCDHQGE